jgi:hypothetical protein
MPYEDERVADVEGESPLCWESEGILRPETTIDLHTGFASETLRCLTCGRRWPGGESPRPVVAA